MALAGSGPLVAAFSGGGDSSALLQAALKFGRPTTAIIIDHGLRVGSDHDADKAAALATQWGADVRIVRLSWPPAGAINQAAARTARYAALASECRALGADRILIGHTADDQAETLLMRAARGAGPRGLAGIAPVSWCPIWPEGRGLILVRPLLTESRQALRDALHQTGAAWLDDPANAAPRFLRTAARAALADSPLFRARLAAVAAALRPMVQQEDAAAFSAVGAWCEVREDHIALDKAHFRAAAPGVQARLVASTLLAASGARRAPGPGAIRRLIAHVADGRGATLGGAQAVIRRNEIILRRDPGAGLGRAGTPPVLALPLPVGEEVVWDGRFALNARAPGLFARAIGRCAHPAGLAVVDADGQDRADHVGVSCLVAQRLHQALSPPTLWGA